MTPQVRVLLAMSSPLVRARLRRALQADETVLVVEEAGDAEQAVRGAMHSAPQLLLCDERIVMHAALGELFRTRKPLYRIVLVSANPRVNLHAYPVPISGLIPLDMDPEEMGARLRFALRTADEQPAAPPRVKGMEHRFVVAEGVAQRGSTLIGGATHALEDPDTVRAQARTVKLDTETRRRQEPAQDRLAAVLRAMQQEGGLQRRDPVTGLANTKALGLGLRALPDLNHPTALVILDLWYAAGTQAPQSAAAQDDVLRGIAAALRANVRQDDMICRIDGMTFAIVMPGLDPKTAPGPLSRLRRSMSRLQFNATATGPGPVIAIGVGYWREGIPPSQPLEIGWQAMLAERSQNAG